MQDNSVKEFKKVWPTSTEQAKAELESLQKQLQELYKRRDEYSKQMRTIDIEKEEEGGMEDDNSNAELRYGEVLSEIDAVERHMTNISKTFSIEIPPIGPSRSSSTSSSSNSSPGQRALPSGNLNNANQKDSKSQSSGVDISKVSTPIVVTLFNYKGGVGKTTATYEFGFLLHQLGFKVLMIDADPQGSLSATINPEYSEHRAKGLIFREKLRLRAEEGRYSQIDQIFAPSLYDQPVDRTYPSRARDVEPLKVHDYDNLFYLPGSIRFGRLERLVTLGLGRVPGMEGYAPMVPNLFREIGREGKFDFVLVDLNPGGGGLNQSIIMGSDYLFMPFKPSLGCLDSVNNLLELIPEWFTEMRTHKQLGKDQGPLLLGTYAQFMNARAQNSKKLQATGETESTEMVDESEKAETKQSKQSTVRIESSFQSWNEKIFSATNELVTAFRQQMPNQINIPFDTYKERAYVVDTRSVGLEAQHSGRPLSDTRYKHSVKNEKTGKSKSFTSNQKKKHEKVATCYKKVVGTHLNFLSEAHKELLSQRFPNFRHTISIWSGLDAWSGAINSNRNKDGIPSSPLFLIGDQHWYDNTEVEHLMKHYRQGRAGFCIMTPLQGDGRFVEGGDLAANISRCILEEIPNASAVTNLNIIIPLNLGAPSSDKNNPKSGNHWALAHVMLDKGGLSGIYYFDPLGKPIKDATDHALKDAIEEVFHVRIREIESLEIPAQRDGYNCGPWIVEAARALMSNTLLNQLPMLDINQRRAEHQAILHPSATNSTGKRKRGDKKDSKRSAKKGKNPATTGQSQANEQTEVEEAALPGGLSSSSSSITLSNPTAIVSSSSPSPLARFSVFSTVSSSSSSNSDHSAALAGMFSPVSSSSSSSNNNSIAPVREKKSGESNATGTGPKKGK